MDLARELRVPSQLTQVIEQTYQRALSRFGPVDGELLAIALLEEEAGLRLPPGPSLTLAAKVPQIDPAGYAPSHGSDLEQRAEIVHDHALTLARRSGHHRRCLFTFRGSPPITVGRS